jgi:hypothetical protein
MYRDGTHPDGKNYEKAFEIYLKTYNNGYKNEEYISKLYEIMEYDEHVNKEYTNYYNSIVDTTILKKIVKPKKVLDKIFTNIMEDNCIICTYSLKNTSMSIEIKLCGHAFHKECLIKNKGECPYRC